MAFPADEMGGQVDGERFAHVDPAAEHAADGDQHRLVDLLLGQIALRAGAQRALAVDPFRMH